MKRFLLFLLVTAGVGTVVGKPGYFKIERHVLTIAIRQDSTFSVKQESSIESRALMDNPADLKVIPVFQPYYLEQFSVTAYVDGTEVKKYQIYSHYLDGGDVFVSGHKQHLIQFGDEQTKDAKKQRIVYNGVYNDIAMFPKLEVPVCDSLAGYEIEVRHPAEVTIDFKPVFFHDSLLIEVERTAQRSFFRLRPVSTHVRGMERSEMPSTTAEIQALISYRGRVINAATPQAYTEWYLRQPKVSIGLDSAGIALTHSKTSGTANQIAQADSIFRWIQQNVRYIADMSDGHSFFPHNPNTVIKNKYGDCKDRAYLFYRMGRELGLPISMALIHTRSVVDWPLVHVHNFNHVMNVMRLPDGTNRYYDPTDRFSDPDRLSAGLSGKKLFVLDPSRPEIIAVPSKAAKQTLAIKITLHEDSLESGKAELVFKGAYISDFRQIDATKPNQASTYAATVVSENLQKVALKHILSRADTDSSITMTMSADAKAFFVKSAAAIYAPKIPFLSIPQKMPLLLSQAGPLYLNLPDEMEIELVVGLKKAGVQADAWELSSGSFQYASDLKRTENTLRIRYRLATTNRNWTVDDKKVETEFVTTWLSNKNKLYKLQ
jgi:hypothetical protein